MHAMNAAPISLSQLESHLWESANILRGPVDAAYPSGEPHLFEAGGVGKMGA